MLYCKKKLNSKPYNRSETKQSNDLSINILIGMQKKDISVFISSINEIFYSFFPQ